MAKIRVVFSVYGVSFAPNELSDILNINPTSQWVIGDLVPNRKKELFRPETCWELDFGEFETLDFVEISEEFLFLLTPKIEKLKAFIEQNNLESKIDVVIESVDGVMPSIFVSNNLIKFLSNVNGKLDFDLF